MKKFNKFLEKNIRLIIIVFLFMQPIIDLLTSLCIHILEIDITFGIVVRILFLAVLFYHYIFIYNKKDKKKNLIYIGLIVLYLILFGVEIVLLKDTSILLYELKNMIRVFYAPILLILLKELKEDISTTDLVKIMFIYILLIVIPTLTNTSFNAYTQGKVGSIGWFNSTNEIAAILSMLFPLFIYYLGSKRDNVILNGLLIGLTLFAMFTLGSKITIISIVITLLINAVVCIVKSAKKNDKKNIRLVIIAFIIIASIGIFLVPRTNFYKNIIIHMEFLEIDSADDLLDTDTLDHFVFSSRLSFLENTRTNYMDSIITEKFLGIGYVEDYGTNYVSTKTIEMDPFDIMYRSGIIGSILFFVVFISVLINVIKKFFKNFKKNIYDSEYLAYMISLFMIIFMSCLSGHVLVSPGVSIFVVIILLKTYKKNV